jgi:hypothetical protein
VDGVSPHDVRIGMAVAAQVIDEPKKGKLLVFVPVNGAKA